MIIPEKEATKELHQFIEDCNGDQLAALYAHIFSHLDNVTWNEKRDWIEAVNPESRL